MTPINFDGFDEYIERILPDWKTPGCAAAIIQDGEIIHWKGFGYRDIEKRLPVELDTVFALASTSKAFTSAGAAILVDRGLLAWDTPVRHYLPDFSLYDPLAAERVTVRDLLSHRTGLPRHDAVWYGTPATRKEVLERLKFLPPSADFRTTYQYQNLMFMAAGCLIETLSGMSWEEFTRRNILEPLGMHRTTLEVQGIRSAPNAALPYSCADDGYRALPYRDLNVIAPAGGINSCLSDLAKWVIMHLQGGSFENREIISAGSLEVTHTGVTNIENNHNRLLLPYREAGNEQYALGWFDHTYRGRRLIRHGGHIDGFSLQVSLMPEIGAGVIVLTNIGGSDVMFVPTFAAYDVLLDAPFTDWSARLLAEVEKPRRASERAVGWAADRQIRKTAPSHPLTAYAGTYRHAAYGDVVVEWKENGLEAGFNTRLIQLKHYHYDTFEWDIRRAGSVPMKASFRTDWLGHISSFELQMEPAVAPLVFEKQPDPACISAATLNALAGDYVWEDKPVRVDLAGGMQLRVRMPGFPEIRLEGYQPGLYKVTGKAGWFVEFHENPLSGFSLILPSALYEVMKYG